MKIDRFATCYNDGEKQHVYFFPGRDEKNHFTSRMQFLTPDIEYQYTKQEDGGIDYIILHTDTKQIEILINDIGSTDTEKITFTL